MSRQKKKQSKSFTLARKVVGATGTILTEIASMLGYTFSGRAIGMGWAEYEDRKARQLAYEEREYLRQLKRRKFIETKRIGEKLMVRLTAKGWQRVLRDRICTTKKKCRDGICFVIFDVPESERRARDTLREVLSDLGFEMIQRSVWATEKDILKELCALLQGAGLHYWVRIVVGKQIRQSSIRRVLTRLPAAVQTQKNVE